MLENVDNLMKNATPVMDASGKLSFLTKDGDTIVSNPFNELERLLDVRQKYDTNPVIESLIRSRGKERVTEGGAVIEKLVDLNENDEKAIRNVVNTLDDADKFDIAMRAGVEVKRDPSSVFKILNQDEVDSGIVTYMKDLAQGRIDQMKTVDEVAGEQLSIQLRQDYRAGQKFAKETKLTEVDAKIDKETGEEKISAFPAPGKKISVNSLIIGGRGITSPSIAYYSLDKDGVHRARISYETEIDVPGIGKQPPAKKKVDVVEDVVLEDVININQVRTEFGLPPIEEVSTTPTPAGGAGKFNK
jgi:hypothetical protein